MNREDDPELWDLLGHSAEPKVSPFFARNVLRETRKLGAGKGREWLGLRRLLPITGLAMALIAVLFLRMQTPSVPVEEPEFDTFANVAPQDYEVVGDLNDVMASDDNTMLDESVFL